MDQWGPSTHSHLHYCFALLYFQLNSPGGSCMPEVNLSREYEAMPKLLLWLYPGFRGRSTQRYLQRRGAMSTSNRLNDIAIGSQKCLKFWIVTRHAPHTRRKASTIVNRLEMWTGMAKFFWYLLLFLRKLISIYDYHYLHSNQWWRDFVECFFQLIDLKTWFCRWKGS